MALHEKAQALEEEEEEDSYGFSTPLASHTPLFATRKAIPPPSGLRKTSQTASQTDTTNRKARPATRPSKNLARDGRRRTRRRTRRTKMNKNWASLSPCLSASPSKTPSGRPSASPSKKPSGRSTQVERTPQGDRIETTVAVRHHSQRRPEVEAEEGINRGDVLKKIVTSKAKIFYLTLPSNSSMTTFPDNTVANFRVKLPQTLDLSGRWEVGLTEIP